MTREVPLDTQRILIPADDQDTVAIRVALTYAVDICQKSNGAVKDAILFLPGKDLVGSSTLTTVIGNANAKTLAKGNPLLLATGVQVLLHTPKTLGNIVSPSVLIAVYADQQMMDLVDTKHNLLAIVAVPHLHDALDQWNSTWTPTVHGEATRAPQQLIDDPVFEQALVALSGGINLSNALLNPRDKDHAETTLRILRANGHAQDPTQIRSWAIRHRWHPKAADELRQLAIKVQSLKGKPKLADAEQAARSYAFWRSKI
jgi:hypothetical protein